MMQSDLLIFEDLTIFFFFFFSSFWTFLKRLYLLLFSHLLIFLFYCKIIHYTSVLAFSSLSLCSWLGLILRFPMECRIVAMAVSVQSVLQSTF